MNVSTQLSAFVLLFSAIVAVMCLVERRRIRVSLAFVVWLAALALAKGGYIFNRLTGRGFAITAIGYLALFAATPTLAMVAADKRRTSYVPLWLGAAVLALPFILPIGAPLIDPRSISRPTVYRIIGLGLFAASTLYSLFILSRSHGSRALPLVGVASVAATLCVLEALWTWRFSFPPVGTALGIVVIFLAYSTLVREERLGRRMLVRAVAFSFTALLLAALYGFLVYRQGDRPALFVVNTLAASFAVLLLYEPIMSWIERQATRLFEQRRDWIRKTTEQILPRIDRARSLDELADALMPALSCGITGFRISTPSATVARGSGEGEPVNTALGGPDGPMLSVWVEPKRTAEVKRLIDAIRDQLKYKLEILELAKRIAEQEKMAAIGALASGLAHQLKNPLSALVAALEMERTDENEALIRSQADRINTIISRFFDFARPLTLKREEVNLVELADSIVENLQRLPENRDAKITSFARLDLARTKESGEPVILNAVANVDPELMQEALVNLIVNAIAATGGKGEVSVVVDVEDERVIIAVEDSGKGIPPQDRDRIFEPFYTKSKGGTGLGLAIVKRIVEAHGGRIRVEDSTTLGGARFVIELPKGTH